jgi:RimJ/RimL family protein N-acetyltransferase
MYIVKKRDFDNIDLRPLGKSDLPLVVDWLKQKEIYEPYLNKRLNTLEIETRYQKYLEPKVYSKCYIIEYDMVPVGLIEQYPVDPKDNDYASLGIRILIGNLDCQDFGIGSASLEIITDEIFTNYDIDYVIANIPLENKIAIRCFKRAGFRKEKKYQKDGEPYLFMIKPNKNHLFI